MKKFFVFLLLVTFAVSIAGCGPAPAGTEKPAASSAPADASGNAKGTELPATYVTPSRIKVTYMIQEHPSTPFNKDWVIWKNLTEATNVELEFMPASGDAFLQKLRMLFSTNDLPDMIDYNLAIANEFGVAGQLAKVNEYIDIMPNYKKILDENTESFSLLTSGDGNMYYLPCYGLPEYTKCWLYRSDIFEKHNLTPPTNTDELYNVLKELKALYPDSTPLTSRNTIAWLADLAYQWKTGQMVYYNTETKKWQFGPAEENFKAMLQYLNKLLSEKLLDPEWSTLATKQWEDKMYADDKTFISFDYVYRIETMLPAAIQHNPNWKIKALPPIHKVGVGEPKYSIRSRLSQTDGMMIAENSKYKTELFKLCDYLYNEEGALLSNFGKVGDTAVKNADGTINWAPNIKTAMNPSGTDEYNTKYGFLTLGSYLRATEDSNKILYLSNADVQAAFDMFDKNHHAAPLQPILKFTDDERKQVAEIETSIRDYVQQEQIRFVHEGSFDKWDQFVARVKDMNIDKLLEIYNAMQARQN